MRTFSFENYYVVVVYSEKEERWIASAYEHVKTGNGDSEDEALAALRYHLHNMEIVSGGG